MGAFLLTWVLFASPAAAPVDKSNDESYMPIAAVHSLLQREAKRVTVRATVTRNGAPIYIQDSTDGAAVEDIPSREFKIGDQILVTGWPEETDRGLVFRNATVRVLWPGIPTPPLAVTADQAALGKFANSLIEVTGRLVREGGLENALEIESGDQIFLAHFDSAQGRLLLPRLQRGSLLRVRGVCSIRPEDTRYLGGFALLLRSAEDIDLISGAPWWSPWHLFELALVLLTMIAAAHVARVRVMSTRFRAIMAERARVAHEMHDTLAQSFAGVAFQIQAAKSHSPQRDPVLERHLDLALEMVRHSHSEAHRSIVMLRPQSLDENTNLREALKQSIERMTEGCSIEVSFGVNGTQLGLPLFVEDALFRVAQESIANALRHGKPNRLQITLDYGSRVVSLTVMDDGSGFDLTRLDRSGFGLPGMRQRIRALHGTFSIVSKRGEGTRVRAEVPRRNANLARLRTIISAYRKHWRLSGTV